MLTYFLFFIFVIIRCYQKIKKKEWEGRGDKKLKNKRSFLFIKLVVSDFSLNLDH